MNIEIGRSFGVCTDHFVKASISCLLFLSFFFDCSESASERHGAVSSELMFKPVEMSML